MVFQYETWKQKQEQVELRELNQLRIENARLQARIRTLETILEKAGTTQAKVEMPEYRKPPE